MMRTGPELIEVKDAAIELLVGIVDWQRRIAGHARAGAHKRGEARCAQPFGPPFNATHASTIPLEIPQDAEVFPAGPERTLLRERLLRNQTQPRLKLAEPRPWDYHPFATVRPFVLWSR